AVGGEQRDRRLVTAVRAAEEAFTFARFRIVLIEEGPVARRRRSLAVQEQFAVVRPQDGVSAGERAQQRRAGVLVLLVDGEVPQELAFAVRLRGVDQERAAMFRVPV